VKAEYEWINHVDQDPNKVPIIDESQEFDEANEIHEGMVDSISRDTFGLNKPTDASLPSQSGKTKSINHDMNTRGKERKESSEAQVKNHGGDSNPEESERGWRRLGKFKSKLYKTRGFPNPQQVTTTPIPRPGDSRLKKSLDRPSGFIQPEEHVDIKMQPFDFESYFQANPFVTSTSKPTAYPKVKYPRIWSSPMTTTSTTPMPTPHEEQTNARKEHSVEEDEHGRAEQFSGSGSGSGSEDANELEQLAQVKLPEKASASSEEDCSKENAFGAPKSIFE